MLSANAGLVVRCFWGMSLQVSMVALQVVKRIVMVVSRWRWVADGGAVL